MKLEISSKLSNWIAQSASYQSYIDFSIEEESIADYTIVKKYPDFYVSLYHLAIDFFKGKYNEISPKEIVAIARGMETFILEGKNSFSGINLYEVYLITASLRLLAGFSATSSLIVKGLAFENFIGKKELQFVLSILSRNIFPKNELSKSISRFLNSGDFSILDQITQDLERKIEEGLNTNPQAYTESILAKSIFEYFKKNSLWSTLLAIDTNTRFWKKYVDENVEKHIWYFFPSQLEAIERGLISSEKTFAMQMPTSAGKTALCELVIYYHAKRNPSSKIILLAPFRSLASELRHSLAKKLQRYGIKVKTLYGGSVPTTSEKNSIDSSNLLIITPEKMMAIEDIFPEVLNEVNLVICDEGHLLDDRNRGFDYELFLTRLKILKNENIRFVFLSAIVPNIEDVNNWLGGSSETVVRSNFRPTLFDYATVEICEADRKSFLLHFNPYDKRPKRYELYNFLRKSDYQFENSRTGRKNTYNFWSSSKKSFSVACSLKSLSAGTVALFAPTKHDNGVSGLCIEIINQIKLIHDYAIKNNDPNNYANKEYLAIVAEYTARLFSEDYLLVQCLRMGFCFHHGSLPQYVREILENCLRDERIRLVVCTNTLAEGVNLPLKTMVIHTTKRQFNQRWHQLSNREIKNLLGRVGRAGKEKNGIILIPHKEDLDPIYEASNDINIHPVKGYLYTVIERIERVISDREIMLTNEIIENQSESFLKLIDSIDSAILDLIGDNVDLSFLDEIASQLVENTFSYVQSNDQQKGIFKLLIRLRSEKIKDSISNESISKVKKSGSSLRFYLSILKNLDFENEIWFKKISPLDENWIDFVFSNLEYIPSVKRDIEEGYYRDIGSFTILKEIAISWLNGATYGKISEIYKLSIDQCLDIVNNLLSYQLTNVFSNIIRIREQHLLQDHVIDESISSWPLLLQLGFNNYLMLKLHSIGFADRIGIIGLSNFLENHFNIANKDEEEIKTILIENLDAVIRELSLILPRLSILEIENILS
ncbi:DEAD/DEAH box helicase [Leptospira levettii]|uniref:DEAD/DEAH box helicase n=1 Tax=Leptospira levettii TaxID=2023178 RepID=A0AAW5V627_9LEPT|nr:DEAD/DEAH box helicase [Leptospira levettii]MCW7467673.1 DEAD/DEAH box helicase [Leptospira levettii]MCW7513353.1 DEAD/DEAH box helicase [Leptospira levettii]MCW7517076.1 DEAD/DEAH box helicase [Leptospira levettii]